MSVVTVHSKEGERTTYSRTGEFYTLGSTYGLGERSNKDPWQILLGDVDELQNKPRRFFDTLLTLIEKERNNDHMIDVGNHREYWDYLVQGCEQWLSAVESGVYHDVIERAEPLTKETKKLKKEWLNDLT